VTAISVLVLRDLSGFVMRIVLLRCVIALLAAVSLSAKAAPASGYWWNPAESGRGFVIEVQGSQMFMAGFLYAANGEATWVASHGAMATATQYSGPLITFSGGQTLTGSYQAPTQNPTPLGTITIDFATDTTATITWPGGSIPIQRFDIVPGGSSTAQPSTNPEPGWWWNSAESGRGFAIEVQNGNMFFAGYMYDAKGNPTWYVANGAMSTAGLFQSEWNLFGNGQTLTGTYVPPVVTNSNVGPVTLQIIDSATAQLTLPGGRQIPLNRFNFGLAAPTLSAFTPASAAPASLVAITGSNINPAATLTLALSDNMGYTVNVPLAAAAAAGIQVSVPPYYNVAAGTFGSGTVSMTLTQSIAGSTATSNTLNGLTIQALPAVPGAGNATLALIQANLQEAQKLQTQITGTAQDTPAVAAALAQQVTNLQSLVTDVQKVVQQGQSYSLGIVGGANITVTPTNISQVDSFILATLQALATPATGSLEKGVEQAANSGCMGAEATAFANALLANAKLTQLTQVAQNLIHAPFVSTACNNAAAFTSAYQIFGGAGGSSIGVTNQGSATGDVSQIGGIALFATATTNADTALGLNALIAPALAGQIGAVQSGIGTVSGLIKPVTDQLLSVTTGDLGTNVGVAQNLILTVAPPPSTGGSQAVGGTYTGSATATSALCNDGSNSLSSGSVNLIAQITVQGNMLTGSAQSAGSGSGSNPSTITGTYNANSAIWSVSIINTNSGGGGTISGTGTIAGNLLSGTVTVTDGPQDSCPGFVTQGVFALTKQ
jgi:hypothetical protein